MTLPFRRPVDGDELVVPAHADESQRAIRRREKRMRSRASLAAKSKRKFKLPAERSPKPRLRVSVSRVNGNPSRAVSSLKGTWRIGDPVPENKYTKVSRVVLMSPEVTALNHWAKYLLLCLLLQYNGQNNGQLKCSFAYMHRNFGWASPNTLLKGRRSLQRANLLMQIEEGHKGRAARYGLSNCLVPKKGGET